MNGVVDHPGVTVKPLGSRLQAIWTNTDHAWCARDQWVYRYGYATQQLQAAFRLPRASRSIGGWLKDAVARSRLKQWLSPGMDIDTLAELPDGDLVVLFDRVYWYSPRHHARCAEPLPQDGIQPPLAMPLRGGLAVHAVSQHAYFGEYLNGHQRDIRVARVDVRRQLVDVCWTFSRSDIKHVHAVHYDRFRNRLWICTGDRDHESVFWYTDDEFQTVHRFAGGDQTWRAIALLFDETGMEWGMDAGQDAPSDAINRIFRFDFVTGERSECAVIGNPAYAACELGDGTAILQTAFEPKRRQPTAPESAIWRRGKDGYWRKLFALAYRERMKTGAGNYGMLLLPSGVAPEGQFLFTPENCSRGNGVLHSLDTRVFDE